MAWMPGASRVQTFSGNRYTAPIDKVVVHTTEGSNWPGYNGGGYAPHVTLKRTGSIRQHIDTAHSAKALENDAGGVQTNNDGALQVECIGSCDRAYARRHGLFFWPDADDDDLEPLARFLAWAHTEHGVPLTTRGLTWSDSNAAYETAPQRMSYSEWRAFSGVCGHQHVPENAHWDPGKLPVERAVVLARRLVNAGGIPTGGSSVPAQRDPDRLWRTSPRVAAMSDGEVREVQSLLADLGYSLGQWGIDGSYGDATGTAVHQLQQDLDITTDGVYGPGTEKALMSKLQRIEDIVTQNQVEIRRVPGKVLDEPVELVGAWEGQTSTLRRMRAWYAEDLRQIKEGIAQSRTAVLEAVQETGRAQGLTDKQVQAIAAAAADASARVSAKDVADRLEVGVKGD